MSALAKAPARLPDLDLAVRQAVEDLRLAHRRLRELQALDPRGRSGVQQQGDRRSRQSARAAIAAAHRALDELLTEDA